MDKFVPYLNIISIGALIVTLFLLVPKLFREKSKSHQLVALALLFLFISTITNLIEHLGYSLKMDVYEDFIKILFLPVFIFSIHSAIINRELKKRIVSEQKFKGLFHQSFSFIGLLNKEGEIVEINESALLLGKIEFKDVVNQKLSETIWWTDNKSEQKKVNDYIEKVKNEGKLARFETAFKIENNHRFIDFSLKPIFDQNQQLLYLIAEGHDISFLKETEFELEKHKNNLEELVKIRTDELETSNEEIVAINEELYTKNITLEEYNKKLIDNKQHLEKVLEELKNAQEYLIESEKMASLGILTAGIAHEINNPINFINQSFIGLKIAIEQLVDLHKEYEKIIETLNDSKVTDKIRLAEQTYSKVENLETITKLVEFMKVGVERTVEIIKSLRYFTHSEKEIKTPVEMHKILENVLTILYNLYKNRIEVITEYHLTQFVYCIPGKINQVVMNILVNAIQSIDGKGQITIKTYSDNKHAFISITDTGCGIPVEVKNKIFDPFFTTKQVGKGTGLGLSICYKIIQEHNGFITVDSSEGIGSEFVIGLPLD